jgi:hypothetical protein
MALKKTTWLWIVAAIIGLGVVFMMVVAGFGFYYVTKHVKAGPSTGAAALESFADARTPFKETKAIFELDDREELRMNRPLSELPTSSEQAKMLWIMAWDSDRERMVKMSMPFWVLRLGRQKVDITSGGFNFERLELDVAQLERVGPVLLIDLRRPNGDLVLAWTK